MIEEFRPVVGFEDMYQVSSLGRVRGLPRVSSYGRRVQGRVLKAKAANQYGHLGVTLSSQGRPHYRTIHRLVLFAFVGPPPPKHIAAHNNGDPTDNRLSNLRWATYMENKSDMFRHGTVIRGSEIAKSVLTESDVLAIRLRLESGEMACSLASEYCVSETTLSEIKNRKTWRWIK